MCDYHIDRETWIVVRCMDKTHKKCIDAICFESKESALNEIYWLAEKDLFEKKPFDPIAENLIPEISKYGFKSINQNDNIETIILNLKLLLSETSKIFFKNSKNKTFNDFVNYYSRIGDIRKSTVYLMKENELEELLRCSSRLWNFIDSPLNSYAAAVIHQDFSIAEESVGLINKTYYFEPKEIFSMIGFNDFSLLPDNIAAFDIEMDTSEGLGLLPRKTTITELSIVTNSGGWVFSGCERYILDNFSNFLNNFLNIEYLVGWNNSAYDNIALTLRSEYLNIFDFNGILTPRENFGNFRSCSISGIHQDLIWKNSFGEKIETVDSMQILQKIGSKNPNSNIPLGLKSFSNFIGLNPVQLDAEQLHTMNSDDRKKYVLSDAACTLVASYEINKFYEKFNNYFQ